MNTYEEYDEQELEQQINKKRQFLQKLIQSNLKNGYMGQLEYIDYYHELNCLEEQLEATKKQKEATKKPEATKNPEATKHSENIDIV
jgi:hypothetical protein